MWRELGLVYRRDRTLMQAARTFIISAPTGGHLEEARRMPKRSALLFTR